MDPGYGIIGLVITICWVIAIIDILVGNMSAGSKIVWLLVVLFLPCIGTVLYFLFGRDT